MSGEKYARAEVMAVINPEGKVPEKKGKLNKCIYCSDYTDSVYGLDIACFFHTEEKWCEHDRKSHGARLGTAAGKKAAKRDSMQARMKAHRDEEQFNGLCRGGCGKTVSGEYTCYDCRTKKQRDAHGNRILYDLAGPLDVSMVPVEKDSRRVLETRRDGGPRQ
jgi:hypothetical protein